MRRTLDFFLNDWLGTESLTERPRFNEHSRVTFSDVLDTCERIAAEKFAPFNRLVDAQEPRLVGDRVELPPAAQVAARAYVESGLLAAVQDYDIGGMQLPCVVEMAANAFFAKAGIGLGGGYLLTAANANLLRAHGSKTQQRVFAHPQFAGRWAGTMCLSEPHAGSSLADITTRAVPDGEGSDVDPLGPRYRIFGNKMWISNGDHELTENIVHLVLAKIPGPDGRLPGGTQGISLFVVPKKLVDSEGQLTGQRNDLYAAGLNHKMGYRGLPNALLNFGDGRYSVGGIPGAVGYRVGATGEGLRCMFHMMNEARIAVGLGAVAVGYAGYEVSLAYARDRRQGRRLHPGGKDTDSTPARIIEHADVRRMLLAQKAYVEGGLALELYCARLVDEVNTGSPADVKAASLLLELLTPVAKSWPSEWCLEANNLAIQVLGGCGYTRDFPVEQLWRDNRLNMIHEGTHGIQGLDLLGRKVRMQEGAAVTLLQARVDATVRRATSHSEFRDVGRALESAFRAIRESIDAAWHDNDAEAALANATLFLQAFGHTVVAWIWLDVALAAAHSREQSGFTAQAASLRGKLQAARFFADYELPKIYPWLEVVRTCNSTCTDMKEEWFTE